MKDSALKKYHYTTDVTDGLHVNTVNCARFAGKRTTKMTMFDRANISVSHDGKYKKVSIMGEAGHANYQKAVCINGYKRIINRGTP